MQEKQSLFRVLRQGEQMPVMALVLPTRESDCQEETASRVWATPALGQRTLIDSLSEVSCSEGAFGKGQWFLAWQTEQLPPLKS